MTCFTCDYTVIITLFILVKKPVSYSTKVDRLVLIGDQRIRIYNISKKQNVNMRNSSLQIITGN